MEIIEHDFGFSRRLAERRFAKLLELDALHEANIRANALPYLERASERIFQLQQVIFEAAKSLEAPAEAPPGAQIQVDKAEYFRLKKCQSIVESGFAKHGMSADVF